VFGQQSLTSRSTIIVLACVVYMAYWPSSLVIQIAAAKLVDFVVALDVSRWCLMNAVMLFCFVRAGKDDTLLPIVCKNRICWVCDWLFVTVPDQSLRGGYMLCFLDDGQGMSPGTITYAFSYSKQTYLPCSCALSALTLSVWVICYEHLACEK